MLALLQPPSIADQVIIQGWERTCRSVCAPSPAHSMQL
jgi:hypothetical protein